MTRHKPSPKPIAITPMSTLPRLVEVPSAALLAEALVPGARVYTLGECTIYWRAEPNLGYHISISHPRRYPTWDEVVYARYQLTPPSITMVVILPALSDYLDMAKRSYGFELWQAQGQALQQDSEPLKVPA